MVAYIFYSHHEYSDVWPIMFGQSEKFLKGKKKYLFTNNVGSFDTKDFNVVLYDDTMSYQNRVVECLKHVQEDICIFHHEDMFLLGEPKWDDLEKLQNMVRLGDVDILKLIKASYGNSTDVEYVKNVYMNPNNLLFAIQPTLIKTSNLKKIYEYTKGNTIWEFENNSNSLVSYLNLKSCYYHENTENKRGIFHWDSIIYPYIATAVVKGKWDLASYPVELSRILQDYNINPTLRGTNE